LNHLTPLEKNFQQKGENLNKSRNWKWRNVARKLCKSQLNKKR